jgi:c-di-GMP-binding flagellar brake protein YcgR
VLDVSRGGAGLELLGPEAALRVGDRIVVDLQLVRSNMARISLSGEVRHVTPTAAGARVGLKFVDVGELEHALLLRLVARQKHERRHPDVVVPLTTTRAFE